MVSGVVDVSAFSIYARSSISTSRSRCWGLLLLARLVDACVIKRRH